jgi:hypothetical protein
MINEELSDDLGGEKRWNLHAVERNRVKMGRPTSSDTSSDGVPSIKTSLESPGRP